MPKKVTFMGTRLNLAGRTEIREAIKSATPSQPVRIATVNPEFMLEAAHRGEFRIALETMSHCTVDGSGLFFFLRLWKWLSHLRYPVELYPGADLISDLFQDKAFKEQRFFLLGGRPGDAERATHAIRTRFNIQIVGQADGGKITLPEVHPDPGLLREIQESKADILLIGFGAPKQELWIKNATPHLKVPVMIGVGGTLDFYGKKNRAPQVMRRLHLEWLWRTIREPGHWRRAWRATAVFSFKAFLWMLSELFLPGRPTAGPPGSKPQL